MPFYEYRCDKCGENFSIRQSIAEHDKAVVKCPKCSDKKVRQEISTFMVKTSKKS